MGVLAEPELGAETARICTAMTVPIVLGTLMPDLDTAYGRHRKTGHNLFLLGGFAVFPHFFNNLEWVWVGLLTHYILDLFGTRRGLGLFWPLIDREFSMPMGVSTQSGTMAWLVTGVITAAEIGALSLYYNPELLQKGQAMLLTAL